jgi:putative hydrolase of the HAD superfamily
MTTHPSDNHAIRTVLFDLGGTLIYFDADWEEVQERASRELAAALRQFALDVDLEEFPRAFRVSMHAYYNERGSEFVEYTTHYILRSLLEEKGLRDVPEHILRAALRRMYAVSQEHWRVEDDAVPTLEALRSQGYALGVVSNASDVADVQRLIDKAGLRDFFPTILISAAVGLRKPHPRIFHLALEQLGARPECTIMVGDTLGADILGAHNAGLASVWITRRADTPDNKAHLDTIRPDATIAALAELPDLLKNWSR